jgi:SAM-dependent methyltransferase
MNDSVQTTHPIVPDGKFSSIEDLALYLIHRKAYEHAAHEFAGSSVLDWGCNSGYGLDILQRTAARAAGLDSSQAAVSEARSRLPEIAEHIRLYDGKTPPFERSSFDAVTSFQVIEHVACYDAYFAGIAHVLKPTGCAMFTTPNRIHRLLPGMKPWNPYHVTEFSPSELESLLRRHFRTVRVFGLSGDATIEDIEKRRCQRALNAACRREPGAMPLLRNLVRLVLPAAFAAGLGRFRTHLPSDNERRFLANLSTAQLQYVDRGIEDAVDLMAICHNPVEGEALS